MPNCPHSEAEGWDDAGGLCRGPWTAVARLRGVSSPAEAIPSEAVCEIVLVSGRRLLVREMFG